MRLLAICLMAFAGFLCCDEIVRLKCSDISFTDEGTQVHIQSSKTHQYRQGGCPSYCLHRYSYLSSSNGEVVHWYGGTVHRVV